MINARTDHRDGNGISVPFALRFVFAIVLLLPWLIANRSHKDDVFFGCAMGLAIGFIVGDLVRPAKFWHTLLFWIAFVIVDLMLFYH